MENFEKKLLEDQALLSEIPLLSKQLSDENLVEVYSLCREVYLLQYNAQISRDGEKLQCFYPNEKFETLCENMMDFIKGKEGKTQKLLDELMLILKKYYIETASVEEKNSKIFALENDNKKGGAGLVGRLFNLNQIDWETFSKGIEENIKIS
ncbi:hypothetical protein [Sporosarcina highlanderae]|uniref:Uncharacterized protein n=1 Tax=Sporosarcina highlanderae TaxID=3035916 RepID=A0ABT8JQE9_9BACL|nr:hypothetical protein [Sporosarcina highlanderae]MDN4607359.1 hypothetical protein [Sporosarcina highlanderae]